MYSQLKVDLHPHEGFPSYPPLLLSVNWLVLCFFLFVPLYRWMMFTVLPLPIRICTSHIPVAKALHSQRRRGAGWAPHHQEAEPGREPEDLSGTTLDPLGGWEFVMLTTDHLVSGERGKKVGQVRTLINCLWGFPSDVISMFWSN